MQGICAISLEKDKAFVCLAGKKGGQLKFLEEKELHFLPGFDFIPALKAGADLIEQAIAEGEKKYSFFAAKIFVELPFDLFQQKVIKEKIVLPKKRKIKPSDINFGKKYIEEKFLEWDERCIHNLILNYRIKGCDFTSPPLGLFTGCIEVEAYLAYLKENFYQDVSGIFSNLERNFQGFVGRNFSLLNQAYNSLEKGKAAFWIGYYKSYFCARDKTGKIKAKEFDFGVESIISGLSGQYNLTFSLAKQLLDRYLTFKVIPYHKEISFKRGDTYFNLSVKVLNDFFKKVLQDNFKLILSDLKNLGFFGNEISNFTVIGPLTLKEGFYACLKEFLPYHLKIPQIRLKSDSLGCAGYGIYPLEKNYYYRLSFWEKIKAIYREYF